MMAKNLLIALIVFSIAQQALAIKIWVSNGTSKNIQASWTGKTGPIYNNGGIAEKIKPGETRSDLDTITNVLKLQFKVEGIEKVKEMDIEKLDNVFYYVMVLPGSRPDTIKIRVFDYEFSDKIKNIWLDAAKITVNIALISLYVVAVVGTAGRAAGLYVKIPDNIHTDANTKGFAKYIGKLLMETEI